MEKVSVLFVCMGNICRSPTAEGVFRRLVEEQGLGERIQIDSAGTHDYHVGKAPDQRSQKAAQRRGVDLSGLRARTVEPADFERFDWILVMDSANLDRVGSLQPDKSKARLGLFLDFAPDLPEREVPDPYYGDGDGFEHVLDLVERGSEGLLAEIRRTHSLS